MNVNFSSNAWEEYLFWQNNDKKILKKINELLKEISRHPYEGKGKPEALKGDLSSFWSRRIDEKHRIVYRIANNQCEIIQCKGHYGAK
ncbi:Toxin YoeB [Commensalibacter sp. Nvir]|uniref:Txe/YoeB family addiction module toxin n=1 Tax=Commensalibacter sp. Nvir TaxID=3069817 RepID=UPI002D6760B5|nr:Toxin YoeB [Commensalibacter sp. Nvir]